MKKILHHTIFFNHTSHKEPLVILHGFLGSSKNWIRVAKALQENQTVIIVDQRNHGKSFHTQRHSLYGMALDLIRLLQHLDICSFSIMGHSMGGLVSIMLALLLKKNQLPLNVSPKLDHTTHKQLQLQNMIIVDISPFKILDAQRFQGELKALSCNFDNCQNRQALKKVMLSYISNMQIIDFLQTNIQYNDGKYKCILNLPAIKHFMISSQITLQITLQRIFKKYYIHQKTLFIRGENSNYIEDSDLPKIKQSFTHSKLEIIPQAGHWLHHTHQKYFVKTVLSFLA